MLKVQETSLRTGNDGTLVGLQVMAQCLLKSLPATGEAGFTLLHVAVCSQGGKFRLLPKGLVDHLIAHNLPTFVPEQKKITKMFGNMLGDMEERQKEMRQKLAEIMVEGTAQGGAVKVTANANREVTDIQIDREKLDWEDVEMVQDLVLDATNKALSAAAAKEAEATQEMVKNMLPPGMGDLGNLLG